MWKLTIEDDEGTRTLLPLVRDEYHIGRDEQNTIRLTERNVSRRHASLKKNAVGTESSWNLVDHNSYNGCYVNGQRVAGHQKLVHSDIIQLGDYRIFVTSDAADAEATGPNPIQNIVPPQEKPDRLVMVAGPSVGTEYPLGDTPLSIGRAEECGISINHPSVSRFHAEVRGVNGRFEVSDKGSANGIRVNTIEFRRTFLEHGDLIELGDVRLRFIERGQIYRPMADMTQQLSAITGKELLPSALPPPKTRTGMVIGAVAAGVLVLVGLVVFSMSSDAKDGATKDSPALSADAADRAVLDAAKKAASVGDHAAAVAKLGELPVNSPARQDPDFASIHNRWAEKSIEKASSAEMVDKSEKKALLGQVAQNTNVSPELRKKAADLMTQIDAIAATDPGSLPTAHDRTGPDATGKPNSTASPDRTAPRRTNDPKDPTPPAATTAPPTTTNTGEVPTTSDSEMKQRKALENKMNSGKASKDDLRLLKEICKHQGDAACKGRVNDALKKISQ